MIDRAPAVLRHAYLLLAVMLGWVLFRASDFAVSAAYCKALFSFTAQGFDYAWIAVVTRQRLAALVAAVVFAMPLGGVWDAVCRRFGSFEAIVAAWGRLAALAALLGASAMAVAAGGYSPFIYARF